MVRFIVILGAILFSFGIPAAIAQTSGSGAGLPDETFAAIAISDKTRAWGYSNKQPTKKAAFAVALRECRKHASDCKVEMWTNRCLALAMAKKGAWGADWKTTKAAARQSALKGCRKHSRGCRIKVAACN